MMCRRSGDTPFGGEQVLNHQDKYADHIDGCGGEQGDEDAVGHPKGQSGESAKEQNDEYEFQVDTEENEDQVGETLSLLTVLLLAL